MRILPCNGPGYPLNYDIGWIGFIYHRSFVAESIAWLTRPWRTGQIPPVDHVFVVSGKNTCIEANFGGVEEKSLDQYFLAPGFVTYLRQPRGWTPDLGMRIVSEARKYVGCKYDFDLIAADALSYSLVGRVVNGLTGEALDQAVTALADCPQKMICDKLAVLAMQAQPELACYGTLCQPARCNNPQKLFGDDAPFESAVTMIKGRRGLGSQP